jgi:uncharacterized protein YgiM (DUF1202 family)
MQKLSFLAIFFVSTFLLSGCSLLSSKQKAGLQVVTDSQKASLFLNDQYLDKTPFISKAIQPGTYTLKIEPDDKSLAPLETTIVLTQGTLTAMTWNPGKTPETSGGVTYELQPHTSKDRAEIEFHTVPDTALITFDNQEQTFSPLIIPDVEPGNHEFEVKLPSYQTQKHTMNAVAGKRLVITVKLAKEIIGKIDTTSRDQVLPATSSTTTATQGAQRTATTSAELTPASLTEKISLNQTNTATDSVSTGSRVKIKPTGLFQDQKEVVRVRNNANTSGQVIGFLEVGQEYRYLQNHQNNFYQIEFGNKQAGWVSDAYADLIGP